MPRLGELCDLGGKLAQYRGDYMERARPVRIHKYGVSDIPADDYRHLIGAVPWSSNGGWSGVVRQGWRDIIADTTGWACQDVEVTIPKPRDGQTYTWAWDGERIMPAWYRSYHPYCADCDRQHAPTLVYCDTCSRCHATGHCREAGR